MRKLGLLLCLFSMVAGTLRAAEDYPLGGDSQRQPGVPQGTVTHYTWTSRIFPGTFRDYWVYVPAQYQPGKPACVMVFQDGESFIKEDGRARVPIVFDNLIAKHELPVTIGVFINPGVLKARSPDQQDRGNRSFEYDALSSSYALFLLDEILPEVAKHYTLSANPDDRAISGMSSGGICAFTAAWNRPDGFHRVLSFIGSFTSLRGGDIYPALIRKTEPKPLRVFLQDGSHDLNNYAGDWWLANQSMTSALEYAGYDVKFVTGGKDHDMEQGGAILPDALRWLWREYPQPIARPAPNHSGDKRTAILDPGHGWELVRQGHKAGWGLAADAQGSVFFTDRLEDRIEKIGPYGTVSGFREHAGRSGGMMFGPDGRLYACQSGARRIVGSAPGEVEKVLSEGVDCQDLAVDKAGGIYFTDLSGSKVWYINPAGNKRAVIDVGPEPRGIHLSPDQSLLYVDSFDYRWVWSFQVQADGSLTNAEHFYRLEGLNDSDQTEAAGMTADSLGFLYVLTNLGIQVFDEQGRVQAIISLPTSNPPAGIVFGGPDLQDLYVVSSYIASSGEIFKRHLLRKGYLPWVPQEPPTPEH